jgi:hypothetical protein
LSLPNEVEVELTVVCQDDLFGFLLVDEELSEVELGGLVCGGFDLRLISKNCMVDLVAFALDVQYERPCLTLDVTGQIVVVSQLKLGLELNLNRQLGQSWHNTRHGRHSEGVSIVGASTNSLLGEVESEWNVLLVNDLDDLLVLSIEQQWTELELTGLEENVGLVDTANNQELLHDVLTWNAELPSGLMFTDGVWRVFKHHLELFTG